MAANQCNKLLKASRDSSNKNVQHLLAVIKPDGSISFSGSDNILHAIITNAEVYTNLQNTINANRQMEGTPVSHLEVVTYPYLPCSPYSKSFKGSAMIRKALDSVVTTAGYGKYGKKLGQGEPPRGWPDEIRWEGYAGASASRLTNVQMKQVIISMYEAVGIDPATHVKPDDREPEPETEDEGEHGGEHVDLGEDGQAEEVDAQKDIPDERNPGLEQIVFVHDENYNEEEIFDIVQGEEMDEVDIYVNDKDEDKGPVVPMTQFETNQDENPAEEEIQDDVGYEADRDEHNYSTNIEQISGDRLEENISSLMYLAGELAKHDENVKEVDRSDDNDDSAKKKKRYIWIDLEYSEIFLYE